MIPVTFDTVATLQFGSEGHPTSLHFAIPEEWKTCKIRLHLRRSNGSFVPPDAAGRKWVRKSRPP